MNAHNRAVAAFERLPDNPEIEEMLKVENACNSCVHAFDLFTQRCVRNFFVEELEDENSPDYEGRLRHLCTERIHDLRRQIRVSLEGRHM